MTLATDLEAMVEQITADAGLLNAWVNGPSAGDTSIIMTDAGPLKTLARIQAEALTGADIGTSHDWTAAQSFRGGYDPPTATDAAGGLAGLVWPTGDTRGVPSLDFGSLTGFYKNRLYYDGKEVAWINNAFTGMKLDHDSGYLFNTACMWPGAVVKGGMAYRGQWVDNDGGFTTGPGVHFYVWGGNCYWFNGDCAEGDPTVENLTVDPTSGGYLQQALDEGDVYVQLHSNGGIGIPGDAKIATLTGGDDPYTITLDQDATDDLVDADFSLAVTAPGANSDSFPDGCRANLHRPFTASIDSGTRLLYDIKFNPQRMGIPPNGIVNGSHVETDARVINYTEDAIEIGHSITGLPINGSSSASGVSLTIDTRNEILTCTGDVSDSSSWITNLSINPIEIDLADGGGNYNKVRFADTRVFKSQSDEDTGNEDRTTPHPEVVGTTANSITFETNAQVSGNYAVAVNRANTQISLRAMVQGKKTPAFYGGYSPTLLQNANQFRSFDIFIESHKIVDYATECLALVPRSTPDAPASGWVLYCDSADGNAKLKYSSGTVATIGTP